MSSRSPSPNTDAKPIGVDVHLSGVVHLYPSPEGDVVALRGIDLDIRAGESIALLGPSGAGKSTVLGLMAGEFAPTAGTVRIGELDISRLTREALARLRSQEISLVVQDTSANVLSYATALENVWFAQHGARRRGGAPLEAPMDLLALVGIEDRANERVAQMSRAERQRVALVAGVAVLPGLLLIDEPTNQLNTEERDQVLEAVSSIHRQLGVTIVVVTHDREVASRFERTVTIRDGRVGAEGRHGTEYAVVGRDGSVHLPLEVSDILPPDSLVRIIRRGNGVELQRVDEQDLLR